MSSIGIIIEREYNQRVRKKSFIITTLLMPLLFIGLMVIPIILATSKSEKRRDIYVVDMSGLIAPQLNDQEGIRYMQSDRDPEELKREDGVFGVLVIGAEVMEGTADIQLYSHQAATLEIQSSITRQIRAVIEAERLRSYDIENLPEILESIRTNVYISSFRIDSSGGVKESSAAASMGLAYVLGFMIYMIVIIYGAMVMQGVIEEKNSRVLEIMVSSVKPFDLMMGKVLGIALVALTQLLIWVLFIMLAGTAVMQMFSGQLADAVMSAQDGLAAMPEVRMNPEMLNMITTLTDPVYMFKLLGAFLIYFLGGYLLYSSLFAAIGSAVDNVTDAQQLQLPVTLPIIASIMIMMSVMRDPNSSLAVWSSMIPFSSPVIMIARIPYGVPAWQIILSVALLYATFLGTIWFAGKIYRVGIFMYGKKPTLKEIIKWARYKY